MTEAETAEPDAAESDTAGPSTPSLSRLVYSTVRERLILGQYPQGSRLLEQRIGEELDVSRVPLREAVPLLSGTASCTRVRGAAPSSTGGTPRRDRWIR